MKQSIINKLKENGINRRSYSIKSSYGNAISITLKSIEVNLHTVERLVKEYQSIDRDERTGEILQGGNTYIFVSYDDDMIRVESEKYLEQAQSIIANSELKFGDTLATFANGNRLHYDAMGEYLCVLGNGNDSSNRHYARDCYGMTKGLAIFNAIGTFN